LTLKRQLSPRNTSSLRLLRTSFGPSELRPRSSGLLRFRLARDPGNEVVAHLRHLRRCLFKVFFLVPLKVSLKSLMKTGLQLQLIFPKVAMHSFPYQTVHFSTLRGNFVFTWSETARQVQRSLLYSEIKLDFLTVSHERAAKWNLQN